MEACFVLLGMVVAGAILALTHETPPAELPPFDVLTMPPDRLLEVLADLRPDLPERERIAWARRAGVELLGRQKSQIVDATYLLEDFTR